MKQLGPCTSEATINLSARPKGLELLGEVSRVPLGQHDDVTFQPQTGELVFKSTQFTLITELGFDRQGFDAAQKQARLKELWEKSGLFASFRGSGRNLITRKTKHLQSLSIDNDSLKEAMDAF